MRFLFLVHGDAEAEAAMTPDERRAIVGEHMAYAAMLRERGAHVLGEALEGRESAAVVRPGDRPFVTEDRLRRRKKGSEASTSSSARAAKRRWSSPARCRRALAWPSWCSRSPRRDPSPTRALPHRRSPGIQRPSDGDHPWSR